MEDPLDILLVEDEEGDIALARELLSDGVDPRPAVSVRRSLADASDVLRERSFDAVILDLGLPDSQGLSSLERVREAAPETPVIVLTATEDVDVGREAIARGAEDYLVKTELSGALLSRAVRYAQERARIRRAMRESGERFRALVENFSEAVLVFSGDEIEYVSASVRNVIGYAPSEWSRRDFLDLLHRADREDVARALMAVRRAPGANVNVECRIRHLSGVWRQVELTLRNLRRNPAVRGIVVTLKDITERIGAERALTAAQERYRAVVENALTGFYVIQGGKWTYVNPRLAEILGRSREELTGGDPLDCVDPGDRDLMAEMLARHSQGEEEGVRYTVSGTRGDGDRFQVEIQGCRARIEGKPAVIGTVQDLTERAQLQERLVRAQRLEGVGQLAGGIAHEFNNVLTTIVGHLDLALEGMDGDATAAADVAEARRAARRGGSIVRQLLAYSSHQVLRPDLLHVNRALADVGLMLDRLIGEDVELRRDLSEFDELVRADPAQLEQVIVNLVVHARDAAGGGGTVTVSTTSRVMTDEDVAKLPFRMPPGSYVELSVADDGPGIGEEALGRVFEPFFRLEEGGEDRRLGLSTAYGLVKQSGGFIHVESEKGVGTAFRVFFPSVEGADGDAPVRAGERDGDPTPGETEAVILLVEDDDAVRRTTARALQTWGYTVHGANHGRHALTLLEEGLDVDLVLTDVVMPEMGGEEFARRARALVPHAECLFMSGYEAERPEADRAARDDRRFIAKPFSPLELAAKVERLLRGRGAPARDREEGRG